MAVGRNSLGDESDRAGESARGGGGDAELLARLKRGEPAAFEEVVRQNGARLYRSALGLLGNAADAEDAVQETLVGAFVGVERFRGQASIRTWLARILVRQAARVRRKRRSGIGSILKLWGGKPEDERHPATTRSPAREVEGKLDVGAMLRELSAEHREVMVLRELEGLSYEEIAGALGVPRGTVESRLHRARQEMRRRFEGYGG